MGGGIHLDVRSLNLLVFPMGELPGLWGNFPGEFLTWEKPSGGINWDVMNLKF